MQTETLYRRVAQKLGAVAANQAMTAEDRELIAESYAGVHAQLDELQLVPWSAEEALPDWAGPILTDMVAATLVDQFGLADPRRSQILAEGQLGLPTASLAERRLRKMVSIAPSLPDDGADYF